MRFDKFELVRLLHGRKVDAIEITTARSRLRTEEIDVIVHTGKDDSHCWLVGRKCDPCKFPLALANRSIETMVNLL